MYLLATFILQNFKKFLEPIQSYEGVPFSGPKWPICPEQIFLVQTIIILSAYWPLPLCKILKKFLQWIQNYDAPFLGPKWPICPNENFFRNLSISFVPFIRAYLHAKSKGQILIH